MVTFAVSPVEVEAFRGSNWESTGGDMAQVLTKLKEFEKESCSEILQASPGMSDTGVATENGFVHGVIRAYNQHHNLILRPDDIWLAIMIQFGSYLNGNAESLRHAFVKHDGKKELVVKEVGSLRTVDYGILASQFKGQMEEHLVDPTFGDLVLPSFSTTTDHDRIVGSVVLMATMKQYFSYKMSFMCGIPNVTLNGKVEDWQEIRRRAEKLTEHSEELKAWADLLLPVLDQFVAASDGKVDANFWQGICHYEAGGSGPSYLSGWISVFCVFSETGKWQGSEREVESWGNKIVCTYPIIDIKNVAPGYLTVDVKIDDNGVEYNSLMFAGHKSYSVHDNNSIAPYLSWAIALKQ